MKICKVFLQEIDYSNNIAKPEYLVEQKNYENTFVYEELSYNGDGSLDCKTLNDFENNIVILEDYKNKLKFTTVYIYDEDGELIKEMELEETKNKIVERNYEFDENGHVVQQEVISDEVTESIKFYYNNSEELISSEHFRNGELNKIEITDIDLFQYNYVSFDGKGKPVCKAIHIVNDNGRISSMSDYDEKDNLIKIKAKYFSEEGFTVYETNYNLIENTLVEEISEYIGPEEYSSRVEKYYENLELVLEKRFRYEYSGEE